MLNIKKMITRSSLILSCLLSFNIQAAEFSVFGDASYSDSDETGATNSFAFGGLDLFIDQKISDNTTAFAEIVFENDGDAFVLDVERLWIGRKINDQLNVSMGRFHTPIGYWNRSYHHGALLFDTISRPTFLDFEDGNSAVLPVHVVGLQADGEFALSTGFISYVINIGNGPSYDTSGGLGNSEIEINNVSDSNNDKSVVLQLSYASDDNELGFGLSAMNNVIAESGETSAFAAEGEALIDQVILSAHVTYTLEKLDVILEYYNLKNDDMFGATGSHTGSTAYAQIGYQLTDNLKPVYRYESIDFDANDAYAALLGTASSTRHVFALRMDLDETNALKFEISDNKPDAGTSVTAYAIQWAFLIP